MERFSAPETRLHSILRFSAGESRARVFPQAVKPVAFSNHLRHD
jgi:hypothetical protein